MTSRNKGQVDKYLALLVGERGLAAVVSRTIRWRLENFPFAHIAVIASYSDVWKVTFYSGTPSPFGSIWRGLTSNWPWCRSQLPFDQFQFCFIFQTESPPAVHQSLASCSVRLDYPASANSITKELLILIGAGLGWSARGRFFWSILRSVSCLCGVDRAAFS